MLGCLALLCRNCQRASGGTQKTFWARYSSASSGSAPWSASAKSCLCNSAKASEMYFKKIRPSTTCLYSAASILLRSLSAACQSVCSKPGLAPLPLDLAFFARFFFAMCLGFLTSCRRGIRLHPHRSPVRPADRRRGWISV